MLDKTQLELVKGLLAMNLGETIEDFEKPSTVIRDPIAPVSGGILARILFYAKNLSHGLKRTPPPQPVAADVWTGFLFRIKFLGVQLELLQQRQSEVPGSLEVSLALFDIQDSQFSFCSRSDQTRTVDFTNHAVIGYDTRYSGEMERRKQYHFTRHTHINMIVSPRTFNSDVRMSNEEIRIS